MSRLGFAPIGEAFMLGSDQIKNTQEEIAKLKALVMDSSIKPANSASSASPVPVVPVVKENYERIGPAPTVTATFEAPKEDNFDHLLSKLIQHPRFDDIVKNYVDFKHPEWVLKETRSTFGQDLNKSLTNVIVFVIIILLLHLLIN
jgi:hypothetical protein